MYSTRLQDAHDSFNDWFEHYHNSKPVEPTNPAGANFTERVAFEHKQKQYEAELERWKHTLLLQTRVSDVTVCEWCGGEWCTRPSWSAGNTRCCCRPGSVTSQWLCEGEEVEGGQGL